MDRGTVTEPQTEAGREYLSVYPNDGRSQGARDIRCRAILAIERQAADAALAGLAETVEKLRGYVNGTTLDSETGEAWYGLEETDSEPGSMQSMGDWLQRGPLLHAIAKARKETK